MGIFLLVVEISWVRNETLQGVSVWQGFNLQLRKSPFYEVWGFFYFIFSGKSIFLLKHTLELVMASSAQSPTVPLPLAKHWQKNWDKRYRCWEKICIYADLVEQEMGFGCSFKCQFFCTHPTPISGWFCSFFGLPITIFNQFSPHSFPLTGEPGSHLPPWWRGQEVQEQTGRPAQTCHQHHALMALPASHGEHHSHQNTLKNGK